VCSEVLVERREMLGSFPIASSSSSSITALVGSGGSSLLCCCCLGVGVGVGAVFIRRGGLATAVAAVRDAWGSWVSWGWFAADARPGA
jgi:hypothetical protein